MSDIMAGLGLTIFPQIALLIFVTVFAAILARLFGRTRRAQFKDAAMLPLDDGPIHRRTS